MNESNSSDNKQKKGQSRFAKWGLVAATAFGVLLLFTVWWLSWDFHELTGKYVFAAQSVLGIFTFIAIVVQALIYHGQWSVMRDSLRQTEAVIAQMQDQTRAMKRQAEVMEVQERHMESGLKLTAEANAATLLAAQAAKTSADIAEKSIRLSHYGYLEMVDWDAHVDCDYSVDATGTTRWGKPREIKIRCRIINAGTSPATLDRIEANFGPHSVVTAHAATIIPNSVGYEFPPYIVDVRAFGIGENAAFTGRLTGKLQYTEVWGKRVRFFDQSFVLGRHSPKCGIEPTMGGRNGEEPDTEENQN